MKFGPGSGEPAVADFKRAEVYGEAGRRSGDVDRCLLARVEVVIDAEEAAGVGVVLDDVGEVRCGGCLPTECHWCVSITLSHCQGACVSLRRRVPGVAVFSD